MRQTLKLEHVQLGEKRFNVRLLKLVDDFSKAHRQRPRGLRRLARLQGGLPRLLR